MGQELGQKLRALRRARRITLKDVARDLSVHFTTVSAWERGRSEPDLEVLRKLAGRLGVGVAELLGVEEAERAGLRVFVWDRSRWQEFAERTEALQLVVALQRAPGGGGPGGASDLDQRLLSGWPLPHDFLGLGSRYRVQAVEVLSGGPPAGAAAGTEQVAVRIKALPERVRSRVLDLLGQWLDLFEPPPPGAEAGAGPAREGGRGGRGRARRGLPRRARRPPAGGPAPPDGEATR